MARRGSRYTDLGRKVSLLAENQHELATALELTQQSISGKLTGKIAITLKDIGILCKKYEVPELYFFSPPMITPELSRVWARVIDSSHEFQQTVGIAAGLPEPFVRQLFRVVQAMRATASFYTDDWQRTDTGPFGR